MDKNKMSNFELVQRMRTFTSFSTKKLPQKISYAITKNLSFVNKEYEIYEKQLLALIEEYKADNKLELNENGELIIEDNGVPKAKESFKQEFNEALAELLNFEVEIDTYLVSDETFNYEDSPRFDALSAEDNLILMNFLCKQ